MKAEHPGKMVCSNACKDDGGLGQGGHSGGNETLMCFRIYL